MPELSGRLRLNLHSVMWPLSTAHGPRGPRLSGTGVLSSWPSPASQRDGEPGVPTLGGSHHWVAWGGLPWTSVLPPGGQFLVLGSTQNQQLCVTQLGPRAAKAAPKPTEPDALSQLQRTGTHLPSERMSQRTPDTGPLRSLRCRAPQLCWWVSTL